MDEGLWNIMTDRDKFDTYECVCQDLAKANARLAIVEAELEKERGSAGFYSDLALMSKESEGVVRAERDKHAGALAEIRYICTSMMDGWGQTVEVLERIKKITEGAIGREPRRPATFA